MDLVFFRIQKIQASNSPASALDFLDSEKSKIHVMSHKLRENLRGRISGFFKNPECPVYSIFTLEPISGFFQNSGVLLFLYFLEDQTTYKNPDNPCVGKIDQNASPGFLKNPEILVFKSSLSLWGMIWILDFSESKKSRPQIALYQHGSCLFPNPKNPALK